MSANARTDAGERALVRVAGPDAKRLLTTALERGFSTFVVDHGREADFRSLGHLRLLTLAKDALLEDGRKVAARVEIATPEDQTRALALVGREPGLLVAARDWKIIPYENLIAACRSRGTRLLVEAATVEEATLALDALEVGVDAVVLAPRDAGDVVALANALAARAGDAVDLVEATVTEIRPVGSGDRVCLDTASVLRPGEGILVGSSSSALFLVHAETLDSGYVNARPFRVNAGPVHAYALLPGGKTRYLSEMRAGDETLVVASDGRARRVVLGRVKMETRPLVLVAAEAYGRRFTTLLQNAETIRLVRPGGDGVSVVDLKPGDRVLVRLEEGGRHFGTAIAETIEER
ncbi:MAG TPA: 3-dehydroquinate synthase II [Candidatus Thermoplasmatota archaeon]|nr:3-dehydroquinate synthase II [Candidatus Thermoplasmatota archaeon]